MNKSKMLKILTVFLILIMVISGSLIPSKISANDTKVIKIGYIDYEGFFDKNEDGTFSGYGVDLLNNISKYTGWEYEFVFDSFANHLESLKTGDIDFICHAQKTESREKDYLFSTYSVGAETSVLYTLMDNNDIFYNDYEHFDGLKIGFLQGSFQNEEFKKFASEHNFSYQAQYYSTQEDGFVALNNKEIDAVVMGSLSGVEGYKVVSLFGSDPFYFMSGKGNKEIVSELDTALGQILASDPTYFSKLYNKYYSKKSASSGIRLTREEAEYIENSPEIKVGVMKDRSPLSYMNDEGQADGMLIDLMDIVSNYSGLKFSYHFMQEGQTAMSYLNDDGGDLVVGVATSPFSTPNPVLLQSETILPTEVVFVGREGTSLSPNDNLVVALPAGFIKGEEVVSKLYPNFTFYHGTSNEDCLKAIRDHKADLMIQNMYVIRECLQSPLFDGLESYLAYSFEENEKVVALKENQILISIINKTIEVVSDDEVNDVIFSNTISKVYHPSFSEILYRYRYPFIGIGFLFVMVVIITIIFIVYRQKSFKKVEEMNDQLSLTNSQLAEAVQQANQANHAKSSFLARMSHEIRTPMNAIVGITEIARTHVQEPVKTTEYLGKIEMSSRILLNIINDVLDMSAIESEKLKIENKDFDLKEVLNGISTIYYAQCKDKGIDFSLIVDIKEEMLIGDSLRVNQILLNLISNAYKFTETGGIKVNVRELQRKGDEVFIRFMVTDTGCGMNEEMKERLFKPFEQEDASVAQHHGGSGLGLSIAKNLIDMMNGAIKVESTKGKGTTFTVDIPFKVSSKAIKLSNDDLKRLKALVIDDEQSAREYTGIILDRIGVKYEIADSGEQAIEILCSEKAQGNHFDICFVDWKMGTISGIDVTRKIRELFSKNTLIIIVSAYDLSEVEAEAKEAGADYFVTKPLFQSTVFNLLMQLSNGQYTNLTADPSVYDFTGHRILLAEDNDLNSEIAIELLNMVNMEVDRSSNGQEALEMFNKSENGKYDLILMDIQMPEMDGYEATKQIRKSTHPQALTIPIIAMTANAFASDISNALSSGMNGHIAKPIDTQVLYRTIADIIKNKN